MGEGTLAMLVQVSYVLALLRALSQMMTCMCCMAACPGK
jgi:hypothetical protein